MSVLDRTMDHGSLSPVRAFPMVAGFLKGGEKETFFVVGSS